MKKNLEEMQVKVANKRAILESHDGEEFSPITVAKNVLCEDDTTMQDYFDNHSEPNISTKIVNSNSMSKVGQGDNVDFSDNVVNGAYESCMLKGKSLVNLINFSNSVGAVDVIKNDDTITVTSINNNAWSAQSFELLGMAHNKTYIACWDSLTFTHSHEDGKRSVVGIYASDDEGNQVVVAEINRNQSFNYLIFTLPAKTDVSKKVQFRVHATTWEGELGATTTIKGAKVLEYQEGMENWDLDYFEGICDVKSPILTNLDANNEQSNTTTFDQKDGKTIVLRSLPNGVCDTLNVRTGEYVQNIGEVVLDGSEDERWAYNIAGSGQGKKCFNLPSELTPHRKRFGYIICDCMPTTNTLDKIGVYNGEGLNILIDSDSNDVGVLKEILANKPITVQYQLATPIVKQINVEGYPYAYENGHVLLESGHEGQSLTPTIEYSIVANRGGQIRSNQRMVERHQKKLDSLYAMTLVNMIDSQYKQVLMKLKSELGIEVRTWDIE